MAPLGLEFGKWITRIFNAPCYSALLNQLKNGMNFKKMKKLLEDNKTTIHYPHLCGDMPNEQNKREIVELD